jgi:hypothetical protein
MSERLAISSPNVPIHPLATKPGPGSEEALPPTGAIGCSRTSEFVEFAIGEDATAAVRPLHVIAIVAQCPTLSRLMLRGGGHVDVAGGVRECQDALSVPCS